MVFICYSKCGTCRKAEKWLREHDIDFISRSVKDDNPTLEELKLWTEKSGLPLRKFFNTSGTLYKLMALKDKLSEMSDEEKLSLLASDGMLVKRPILVSDDFVLVGFKEPDWEKTLGGG